MIEFCNLHGLPVARSDYDGVLAFIRRKPKPFRALFTLNPEIIVGLQSIPELKKFASEKVLCLPDGRGLKLAARLLKGFSLNQITGVDLAAQLLERGEFSVYLVGATPQVLEKIRRKFPSRIVGAHHGYYSPQQESEILDDIAAKNPDVVLAAMGFPKQEIFLKKCAEKFSGGVGLSIGGALDVISGEKKRAPKWLRKLGLEWFYRGLSEPKRLLRWGFIPRYVALLISDYSTKSQ